MVEVKRGWNRQVLKQSRVLDTVKLFDKLVANQTLPEVHYYAEEALTDNESERGESVNKTATKVVRVRHKNTNYDKIIFGHEKLDFETMTKETFAKCKLKK
jgi:hypothetical protein